MEEKKETWKPIWYDLVESERVDGRNGRVIFRIHDTWEGPRLKILSTNHGTNTMKQEILIDQEGLAALAVLFQKVSEHKYRKPHPKDGMNVPTTIMCGDIDEFGDCTAQGNLDIYYNTRYVQNEKSNICKGDTTVSQYIPAEFTPVIVGTLTGTIYRGEVAIQTFILTSSGELVFTVYDPCTPDWRAPEIYVTNGTIILTTGEIVLKWNAPPGENHIVTSYEYQWESND